MTVRELEEENRMLRELVLQIAQEILVLIQSRKEKRNG